MVAFRVARSSGFSGKIPDFTSFSEFQISVFFQGGKS
jgi:hypothetical protein